MSDDDLPYYDKFIDIQDIEAFCTPGKRGVSLQAVKEAAEKLGFDIRAIHCSIDAVKEDVQLPCILYWESKHFVVLYKTRKGKFYIADPDGGYKVYRHEESEYRWASKFNHNLGWG